MDPHLAAILKIAPLASKQLRAWRQSNPAKNLDRLVRAELDSDSELGVDARESLYGEWLHLAGDARGAVLVAGLLEKGDITFLDALAIRSREILTGLETLPLGIDATIERLVAAVRNNFAAAQKDAARATQRGVTAVLTSIDALATGEQVERVEARLSNMERLLARPPERVLVLPLTLDETQHRHLSELQAADSPAAARLGEILEQDGVEGLVALVTTPPEWTQDHGAALWIAVGRILGDGGPLAAAEKAHLAVAVAADVDDRVDAVMAAARCAEADKRPDDADRHLARARNIDDKHPLVKLFDADRAVTPEGRLALASAVSPNTDQERALRESQRAVALLTLNRFDEARAAAQASNEANPHGSGEELIALVTIIEARNAMPRRGRDDRPLLDAIDYHVALRRTMLTAGRVAIAGVAGARAALGTAVLGDRSATSEAIDVTMGAEGALEDDGARQMLLDAALVVGDVEHAKLLLPEPDDSVETASIGPRSRSWQATTSCRQRLNSTS